MEIDPKDFDDAQRGGRNIKKRHALGFLFETEDILMSAYRRLLADEQARGEHKPFRMDYFGRKIRDTLIEKHRKCQSLRAGGAEVFEEHSNENSPTTRLDDPAARLALRDVLERAFAKLETIAPRRAVCTKLSLVDGLEQVEIAARLGISIRTVQIEVSGGREWLQAFIDSQSDASDDQS